MEPLQIAEKIKEEFPEEIIGITEFRGQVSVHLKKKRVLAICHYLRQNLDMDFDYLMDLCGVDYKGRAAPRFEVVYHLYSIAHKHMIRLRVQVPEHEASLSSVVPVWRGADWHERECFDMFGITFEGHPDLRRILMPEDWVGYPLRKDYPVKGPSPEEDWPGYKEVVERSKRLKGFGWER